MASEQLSRRENTTTERQVHIEKDRVPKMATHFEHLAEQVKESDAAAGPTATVQETPHGSIEALQGGEMNKDHAGRAIGDIGGQGRARESHEVRGGGAHFESLADKVKGGEREVGGGDQIGNMRERQGGVAFGVGNVGKFEMQETGEEQRRPVGREDVEGRTREVMGKNEEEENERRRRSRESMGQVVAEKGGTGRKQSREEETKTRTENFEENRGGRVGFGGGGEKGGATAAVITATVEIGGGGGDKGRGLGLGRRQDQEEAAVTVEQGQRNANEVASDAQNRYQSAKQSASETLSSTAQTAQQKAAQVNVFINQVYPMYWFG